MASIVVGLFEHRSDAEAALSDLVSNNYEQEHIDLKEPGTDNSQQSPAQLRQELEGEGIPESDALLFQEGVQAGDALVVVHTSDDRAELAREIMNGHGALDIHDASVQRGSIADPLLAAPLLAAPLLAANEPKSVAPKTVADEIVVPIVEEELSVGKRQIQRGGVRVFQRVENIPVTEAVTLRQETVTVDRRPVDRAVTNAETAFAQAADVVVTTTDEVPVVSKEARVVEEVVVGKVETDHTEVIQDTVRRTDIDVEQINTETNKRN